MKSSENILRAKSKKYQHSFQPIYYVLRFVGLWPFTINYNPNGSIKGARVSIFDGFWFIIAICLYLISLFYTCEFMKHQDPHKSNYLSELLFYLSQIPTLLLGGVNVVLDMFNRKSIVNVLQKFITFDNKVGLMITMNTHNHNTITFWIIVWSFAFEYFFHNAGIQLWNFFQLQKWKTPRTIIYIGTNIDSTNFTSHECYSLWIQFENIIEFFTMGCTSIASIYRVHFSCKVLRNFHPQPLHTICCTEFSIKVS